MSHFLTETRIKGVLLLYRGFIVVNKRPSEAGEELCKDSSNAFA
jgi:hypothetical protein